MFKEVVITLDEVNHKYNIISDNTITKQASTVISGSGFFKPYQDNSRFTAESKLYGLVAMNLGTSIHKIMEDLITHYKLYGSTDILKKISARYEEENSMFSNILLNMVSFLEQEQLNIASIDLEITKGIYCEEKDLLFCGTADVIVHASNDKILMDYKTMLKMKNSTFNFIEIFNTMLHDLIHKNISYDYFLEINDIPYNDFVKLQKKALNYIHQFGLYALLNKVDSIYMITSYKDNGVLYINKDDTLKLINLVKNKIKKDFF
jgi:hypothetical protein